MPDSRYIHTFITKQSNKNKKKTKVNNKSKSNPSNRNLSKDVTMDSRGRLYSTPKNPTLSISNHDSRYYFTLIHHNSFTQTWNRQFASMSKGKQTHSLISDLLQNMDSKYSIDGFTANEETQRSIEKYVSDEFRNIVPSKTYVASVDTSLLGNVVSSYVNSKLDLLNRYTDSLFKVAEQEARNKKKVTAVFTYDILNKVDKYFIIGVCIHHFLTTLTHQDTENDSNYTNLLGVSVKIGKKLVQKYIFELSKNVVDVNNVKVSYSSFLNTWKSSNNTYAGLLDKDDTFHSNLGCKLIEILQFSEMLKTSLVRTGHDQQHQELVMYDDNLKSQVRSHKIYAIPAKLPMIVKPKPYSINVSGGYLLNDIEHNEELIIDNKTFKYQALYTKDICVMVNNISGTAFKVNSAMYDFITDPINEKHNLLLDSSVEHEYAHVKRTRSQKRAYKSYNSKLILQETILERANFFKNFNEIYFPVRLDNRGRLYCTAGFFNYQSTELSKALIQFAKPGIILKTNYESRMYLKAYGVNCFGGATSKQSIQSKQKWVDDHIDDIVNFDNGVLLLSYHNRQW